MTVDQISCSSPAPNDPGRCNDAEVFPVSHDSPGRDRLFIAPASDVWTRDARWKFVIGHELGHEVQDFANAGLDAIYRFVTDTDRRSTSGQLDPASSLATAELTRDCSCVEGRARGSTQSEVHHRVGFKNTEGGRAGALVPSFRADELRG